MNTASGPLPVLWALSLLTALVVGLTSGLLTFQQTKGSWPAALLACIGSAGATVYGMHEILT